MVRCPPSTSSCEPTPTSSRTTSPGSSCSWRTGRSSPTSRSPTSCCGSRTARAGASGPAGRCGPPPARPRSSTTCSARSSRPGAGGCSTRPTAPGRLVREGDPEWRDDVPVRVEVIPVRRAGRVIAIIARNTNLLGVRTPSRLELSYLQTAAELTQMIASGHFPLPGQRSDHADSPRVGDGFVRLDPAGKVDLRQPQRAVGLPPARAAGRPGRAGAHRPDPRPGAGRASARTRRRSARCWVAATAARPRSAPTRSTADRAQHPAAPAGRAQRRAAPGPRRHRAAQPRPRAGHQGRRPSARSTTG